MRELIISIILVIRMITQNLYPFLISNQPSPATVPKMPNLSLIPLKPSCHPQHDMRDAVLKYAIALLNK